MTTKLSDDVLNIDIRTLRQWAKDENTAPIMITFYTRIANHLDRLAERHAALERVEELNTRVNFARNNCDRAEYETITAYDWFTAQLRKALSPAQKEAPVSIWCQIGKAPDSHAWCMNRDESEAHCACECHKSRPQLSYPDATPDADELPIEVITTPDGSIAGVRRNEGKGRYTWLRWVRYVGTASDAAPDAQREARETAKDAFYRATVCNNGTRIRENCDEAVDAILAAAKAGERR